MSRKRRSVQTVLDDLSYICQSCGEEIVVPVDVTAGEFQEYIEDCPICCRPHLIHIELEEDGTGRAWADET